MLKKGYWLGAKIAGCKLSTQPGGVQTIAARWMFRAKWKYLFYLYLKFFQVLGPLIHLSSFIRLGGLL
jgi:hypothetical protein